MSAARLAWSPWLPRLARPLGIMLVAGLAVASLIAVLLAAGGFDVQVAAVAAWRGAAGSPDAFISATLVRATPLMLCGLAVSLAFRAGVLNIGADGQFLAGAMLAVAAVTGLGLQGAPGVLAALGAAAIGGAWASSIPALLRRRFGVLEVVSTIMMNFVAIHILGYLVRGPLQEPTRVLPQSASIGSSLHLPILVPGSRLHLGFLLAIIAAVLLWVILRSSATGFRWRVVGANPAAAQVAARVDTGRTGFEAFLISGALAGLAGGVEVLGVTFALYENLSPGYGYTAIAVALMAGLHPLGVIGSAIFFGGLAAAGAAMQREAGVPSVVALVVEALVILCVVTWGAVVSRRRSPAAMST